MFTSYFTQSLQCYLFFNLIFIFFVEKVGDFVS